MKNIFILDGGFGTEIQKYPWYNNYRFPEEVLKSEEGFYVLHADGVFFVETDFLLNFILIFPLHRMRVFFYNKIQKRGRYGKKSLFSGYFSIFVCVCICGWRGVCCGIFVSGMQTIHIV